MVTSQASMGIYLAMIFLMELLGVLAAVATFQLIGFHSYLACKGMTTYEYILKKRGRDNRYKVSAIKMINEREGIQEVPLEQLYEPYEENPQFKHDETQNEIQIGKSNRVVPQTVDLNEFHKELNNLDNV